MEAILYLSLSVNVALLFGMFYFHDKYHRQQRRYYYLTRYNERLLKKKKRLETELLATEMMMWDMSDDELRHSDN